MKMLGRVLLSLLAAGSMLVWFTPEALAGRELVVSAAASLTDAFKEIGEGFAMENPGVNVTFNFGASGPLLQQVIQGAPVDVLASADVETMDKARQKGVVLASSIANFAGNRLVLVVPMGSVVSGLKDLEGGTVRRIAVGKPETVPAGRYAKEALERSGMWGRLEPKLIFAGSVRQVLDYVSRGEVDGGFVYATDAAIASGKARAVCEVGGHKPVVYPIAVVSASRNKQAAAKFIEYVTGARGGAVLARYGFTKP